MYVGALKLELYMPQSRSLKDKRQVLRSIIDRTRNRFNVAVAEVDNEDFWQLSTLGVTCVSNSEFRARQTLHRVERSVRALGKAEVLDSCIRTFTH